MKLENNWIIFVWAVIFMVWLVWDQEKIVVLNMVLFLYFIKYMASDSIISTLDQKRELIRTSLIKEVNMKILYLKELINTAEIFCNFHTFLLTTTIKKISSRLIHLFTFPSNNVDLSNTGDNLTFNFSNVNFLLWLTNTKQIQNLYQKNLLALNYVHTEVSSSAQPSEEEELGS